MTEVKIQPNTERFSQKTFEEKVSWVMKWLTVSEDEREKVRYVVSMVSFEAYARGRKDEQIETRQEAEQGDGHDE